MLVFANGERERALLEGVPRAGDYIRLTRMTPQDLSLLVEQVLWSEVESTAVEATITVAVTPHGRSGVESVEAAPVDESPEKPE